MSIRRSQRIITYVHLLVCAVLGSTVLLTSLVMTVSSTAQSVQLHIHLQFAHGPCMPVDMLFICKVGAQQQRALGRVCLLFTECSVIVYGSR